MDQGGEGDALEIQKVEVFERQGADAPWHPVGEGTVLWQAGAEGRVEQRLLVMEPDGSGEWARELEALDFPDPNLAINCLPEDSVLTWRSGGQTREVALAFKSQEGCLQVWEDVQALQELAFHGGAGDGSMTDFLDQFADGADGGGPLPPPSEDSLSQVGMRLSTCPPGLMPLLLQQLIGAEAAAAAAAAAVSGYAQAFGNAGAPPAVGGTARGIDASSAAAAAGEGSDYVSQLCAIAIRLAEGGGGGGGGAESPQGGGGSPSSRQGKGTQEWADSRRSQLAGIFRALLSLAADEPALMQRLLQTDALHALLLCLEAEESKLHKQTQHVNVQHVAFLSDSR